MIIIAFTRSRSTRRQTFFGSNFAISTVLRPTKLPPMTPHCVAPCMSGAIGNMVSAPARPRSAMSSGFCARMPVRTSMPPPSVINTSSWRQTTPFGMPVVPPV